MMLDRGGRVHFVGIGGAGMSAIAKVLVEQGIEVSGSDLKRSRLLNLLEAMGAHVHLGHEASLVDGAGAVVVSSAIAASNPELARARETGIEVVTRGEALATLLNGHKPVVVAGTHGKTTTTSMIVSILHSAGRDPTYLVGGGLNDAGTNAKWGRDDVVVAEADESDGSFLLLHPEIAVVTNVEADHLDYWKSLDAIHNAFLDFMRATSGVVVAPAAQPEIVEMARSVGRTAVTFGEGGDVAAEDIVTTGGATSFTLVFGSRRAEVNARVPGMHNVLNALAAAAACLEVGVSLPDIASGLSAFRGVERRWQVRGTAGDVTIVDDYAHHPTEVRATLAAARPGPWDRVVAVFQPHRYSRTHALAQDFGAAFGDADQIVITDVYGAGEAPVPGVTGKLVADAVCAHLPGRGVAYLPHRAELLGYLKSSARPGDALFTLGAGDITSVGEELLELLGR